MRVTSALRKEPVALWGSAVPKGRFWCGGGARPGRGSLLCPSITSTRGRERLPMALPPDPEHNTGAAPGCVEPGSRAGAHGIRCGPTVSRTAQGASPRSCVRFFPLSVETGWPSTVNCASPPLSVSRLSPRQHRAAGSLPAPTFHRAVNHRLPGPSQTALAADSEPASPASLGAGGRGTRKGTEQGGSTEIVDPVPKTKALSALRKM